MTTYYATYFENNYEEIYNLVIEAENEEDAREQAYNYFTELFDLNEVVDYDEKELVLEEVEE
jgi:hypothetical protein